MLLLDVNVLVYAHRTDSPNHPSYLQWLEGICGNDQAFGMSDIVLAGFLRIVTHPRVFNPASTMNDARAFVEELRNKPNCVLIHPGPRHWGIFTHLCQAAGIRGNLVPDAYLAALAIESGSEWITTDRDFSRFPGLYWRHPLGG